MIDWFETHRQRLERAVNACATRSFHSEFQESPSRRFHPEGAAERGRAWFEAQLGRPFELDVPGEIGRIGAEVSPYTGMSLGVDYPLVEPELVWRAAKAAIAGWQAARPEARVGVCLEIVKRMEAHAFELAWATHHTTGQSFVMAFSGSGANALDRGLEAVAHAYLAMKAVPESAEFTRAFGGASAVRVHKRYHLVPRGVALVLACGSYPSWNAWPALFANLATGNLAVLKPHPATVLPMALTVRLGRQVLQESGFDPNVLQLVVDSADAPVAKSLAQRRDTAIVDFTGSPEFGGFLERECAHARVYTETAGCNALVVESTDDLDALLRTLANALCLFSAQMCTTPQNIWIPSTGVLTPAGPVLFAEFGERLRRAVDALVENPVRAAAVCGAVHAQTTVQRCVFWQDAFEARGRVIRRASAYLHPEFPQARTLTPLILSVPLGDTRDVIRQEIFGPVSFVVEAEDAREALQAAARDAQSYGSISNYVYSTNEAYIQAAERAFVQAGSSVAFNLIRHSPIQFSAAYSDYHVTGLNPAGNACLADAAFVVDRFRIVQSKRELCLELNEVAQ